MSRLQAHDTERRQYPRKLVEIKVSLSCGDSSAQPHVFNVYDISLSGMAIHSDSVMPKLGEQLCICLSPGAGQCSRDHLIEATVVRVRDGLVGVHFDSVGVKILKDIQRILSDERYF